MDRDNNDIFKQISDNLKFKMPEIKIQQPSITRIAYPINMDSIQRSLDIINREKAEQEAEKAEREAEKDQREKDTLAAMQGLLELAKENPAAQQHIQTLIQNSGTIHNMQNVHSGATGNQNIINNTGVQAEEMLKLLNSMREISDILLPDRAEEAHDLINELEQEVQKPEAKPGRIKASLTYLKSLFTDIIGNPTKTIAKAQFTEYGQEKAPEIIQGIEDIFKSMNS